MNSFTFKYISLISLLACFGYSQAIFARPIQTLPKYQVEVIIFQTLALRGWTEEYWPQNPDIIGLPETEAEAAQAAKKVAIEKLTAENPNQANAPTIIDQPAEPEIKATDLTPLASTDTAKLANAPERLVGMPQNYELPTLIDPADFQLQTEADKMTPAKGYQILMHQAWVITGYPEKQAQPLILKVDPQRESGSRLEGTLTFYKSRFAHITFNLELERKIPFRIRQAFADNEHLPLNNLPEFWRFRIKESRKIKSGELHYIDHPIFGVLVKMQYIKGSQHDI